MPCKGGYRKSIGEGKLRREEARRYEKSAERQYWRALVDRVYKQAGGFAALGASERTYWAVNCLSGEVYNGGFYQFFSNSTGELYELALEGLVEMGATHSAGQLRRVKELFFGAGHVPADEAARNAILPALEYFESSLKEMAASLDAIEEEFYADPDELAQRCAAYAAKHGLYDAD